MKLDAGARQRCDEHGLYFNPTLNRGCTLCRRDDQPGQAARPMGVWVALCAVLIGISVGTLWLRRARQPATQPPPSQALTLMAAGKPAPAIAVAGAGSPAVESLAADAALQPIDPSLWREIQADWEPVYGDEPGLALLRVRDVDIMVSRLASFDIQGKLQSKRATPETVARAARQLAELLLNFPGDTLSRSGLQHVLLVEDLVHKGVRPGAMAMAQGGVLITTPGAIRDPYRLNHELFHFIDYRAYGFPARDAGWSALSGGSAAYVGARGLLAVANVGEPREDLPGFVTAYAQGSPEEDRAEIFATLRVRGPFAAKRRAVDPVIAAKCAFVLDELDRFAPDAAAGFGLR